MSPTENWPTLGHCADAKLTQVFYLLCLNFGQGMNKVITMEMLGRIRRMYLRDKVSLHEIAKRTGLSRNTVRCLQTLCLVGYWHPLRVISDHPTP